jgi:hypothetical protein
VKTRFLTVRTRFLRVRTRFLTWGQGSWRWGQGSWPEEEWGSSRNATRKSVRLIIQDIYSQRVRSIKNCWNILRFLLWRSRFLKGMFW